MDKLRLYHGLPYALKVLAASAKGLQLERWRYGAETEELVNQAFARESWTLSQWSAWQQQEISRLLHRAATKVPYYRSQWEQRRAAGDQSSWELLTNWPILEKESLHANPRAFLATDCNSKSLFHTSTSGTTGKPLTLWQSRQSLRTWYALTEARWRRWNGVSRQDRWAIFGGQLVTPVQRRRPPFWVWNAAMNQLYASSYHLAPDLVSHYVAALRRYNIVYLWGYTSALYTLAHEALAQKLDIPAMKVVLTNAEPLYDFQRRAIAAAFRCPVRETYGMSEIAAAASECAHGCLHLWPEAGLVEVFKGEEPVGPRTAGDLVLTGLLNRDMPLVRYRIGDAGALGHPAVCPCGRNLPILQSLDGRVDDIVHTRDGRRVGRLDPVFKGDLPVKEVQIIQESLDQIRVVYVPAAGFTAIDGDVIVSRLRDRLGSIAVDLQPVDHIPLGPNGKFRAVISKIRSEAADASVAK